MCGNKRKPLAELVVVLEVVKVRKEKGHSESQDRVRLGSSCESSDKRLPLCFGDCRLQHLAE